MRRTALTAIAAGIAVALTGCSSGSGASSPAARAATAPTAAAPSAGASNPAVPQPDSAAPRDAGAAVAALSATVPNVREVKTYTADNDPNHLLGRPHQYLSKTAFADARIQPADVEGEDEDSVTRGGSVEVFATAADAQARVDYIAGIIKNMPVFTEYDYVHGAEVLRVSKLLTPNQAEGLETALKS
ncbi:hypothetical protein [Kitasatospora cineracea]|uniref:Lipoprotein n=1 Tax=Kitasatospora cineracea TaxID=88074 RepID=A0A8G1XA83_9ACTN|nr:hypothetical protein [Kitasatospora cineracea]ROR42890.1 hypothetical protein EDD39_1023 [Kitasatospora cineracea]